MMNGSTAAVGNGGAWSTTNTGSAADGLVPVGLDQRWSELCSGLQDLEMKYLDSSCDTFRSSLLDAQFGDLKIRRVMSHGGAHRAMRTRSMIGSHGGHLLWICVVLKGRLQLQQDRRCTLLEAGDLSIVDYAQTYAVDVAPPLIDSLWIGASRALMDSYVHDVDAMLGSRVDRNLATTQTAMRVATAAFADLAPMSVNSANRIAHGVLGILATAFDGSRAAPGRASYRNHILRRIKGYIDEHLDDDELTVREIARKQGISARYLAKIFEAEKQSVARWIWDRRLERCRVAMREAGPGTTITEIAYSNGFKNLSHFCRIFKARYGSSPGSLMQAD